MESNRFSRVLSRGAAVLKEMVRTTRAGSGSPVVAPSSPAAQQQRGRVTPAGGVSTVGVVSRLTPREHDVLRSLSTGARTKEIADQLGIAERTVKGHLATIYLKLGVGSRSAALAAVRGTEPIAPPT